MQSSISNECRTLKNYLPRLSLFCCSCNLFAEKLGCFSYLCLQLHNISLECKLKSLWITLGPLPPAPNIIYMYYISSFFHWEFAQSACLFCCCCPLLSVLIQYGFLFSVQGGFLLFKKKKSLFRKCFAQQVGEIKIKFKKTSKLKTFILRCPADFFSIPPSFLIVNCLICSVVPSSFFCFSFSSFFPPLLLSVFLALPNQFSFFLSVFFSFFSSPLPPPLNRWEHGHT